MKCPNCGCLKDKVLDTRQSKNGTVIRRRRECLNCGFRFTTYERYQEEGILVKKKKGYVEPFKREKIIKGVQLASKNIPIPYKEIERIADMVEQYILEEGKFLVESKEIGYIVQEELKKLDKMAYIRFKSVYEGISDIKELENILKEVKNNN